MIITTKTYETPNGMVEGVQLKWDCFGLILVTGSKGFLTCGVFDLDAIEKFGGAAALVESTPENPIGTLDRFPNRKVVKTNKQAEELGIKPGMDVIEAFSLMT